MENILNKLSIYNNDAKDIEEASHMSHEILAITKYKYYIFLQI
tara:strand:+ start:472 stop:600 length:129 start_codon:yes stop_codon:yes gene_type:complete